MRAIGFRAFPRPGSVATSPAPLVRAPLASAAGALAMSDPPRHRSPGAEDPFIVYTSNIFAILGLRALYFALAAMVHRFHYLKYALSVLLVFIGSKIFVADLAGLPGGKFPPSWGLGITFAILAAGDRARRAGGTMRIQLRAGPADGQCRERA